MIDLFAADMRRIMWRLMTHVIAVVVIVALGVVDFQHTAKHPFNVRTGLPNAIATFTGPVVLVAFIVGASLLGANYTSRSLTTLLTWEPRARSTAFLTRGHLCSVHVLRVVGRDSPFGVGPAARSPCACNGPWHSLCVSGCSRDAIRIARSGRQRDRRVVRCHRTQHRGSSHRCSRLPDGD
jgi:hypothetical protein